MSNNIEHLFIFLLVIHVFSYEVPAQVFWPLFGLFLFCFANLKIELYFFVIVSWGSLYIVDMNICFVNIFCQSVVSF